jgi:site-specific DNA recombinase
MNKRVPAASEVQRAIRCAIYTRKSTEEGLQQEFNSLDAQRESAEAYIASQKAEGWVCLSDRYDDGGFTGANMERPALKRLIVDIEANKIDCVIVYKVDRLSRSLLDFARMMETFDRQKISFVSVTQHFNTTHSMGRLTLNILLSFAQFEREIISERTRDKIAAARRRGKWSGGHPPLGYDLVVSPTGSKLIVNEDEASRVRSIFELYLQHERMMPVVQELSRRGWNSKVWTTRQGSGRGGSPLDKTTLFRLLNNPIYLGKVKYRDELHAGEHVAIVDESVWRRVQAILRRNAQSGGATIRNKYEALLRGLVRCASCDALMCHTFSSKGNRRYRYYVCLHAQKRGWKTCPTKSISAAEIERFVVDQIRNIGKVPQMFRRVLQQVHDQRHLAMEELHVQERTLLRELKKLQKESLKQVAIPQDEVVVRGMADLQDRVVAAETRLSEVRLKTRAFNEEAIDERSLQTALAAFDPVWDTLSPQKRSRIIHLLVDRIDYDGVSGLLTVTFWSNGIGLLAKGTEDAA